MSVQMKKVFCAKKGFTLVELLVVIAIIGILAAVVAPKAFTAIEKSKVSRTLSDLKAMRTAALQFYADVGFFPGDIGQGVDPGLASKPGNKATINPNDGTNGTSLARMGITDATMYNKAISNWSGPYIDSSLTKKTAWSGMYDYECWWPGRGSYPEGIWITIHGIPEKSANLLVQGSSFTIRNGDPRTDDITINGKKLMKVSLKIADWPN